MPEPETETTGPWYGDLGLTDPAQINQIKNYKSKDDAILSGLIPAKQKLSTVITPPNPEAADYRDQVRTHRLKYGAKATPEEYSVKVPDDLAAYVTEAEIKSIQEAACKYGLLPAEFNERLEENFNAKRSQIKEFGDATSLKEKQENERKVKADLDRDKIWGSRKSEQLKHVDDMTKYFDNGLLAEENKSLSPEVIGERGGLFAQLRKTVDSPLLDRVLAVYYDKFLAEGSPMPSINQGATNEYLDRMEKVKARYPKRPGVWEEIARDRTIRL